MSNKTIRFSAYEARKIRFRRNNRRKRLLFSIDIRVKQTEVKTLPITNRIKQSHQIQVELLLPHCFFSVPHNPRRTNIFAFPVNSVYRQLLCSYVCPKPLYPLPQMGNAGVMVVHRIDFGEAVRIHPSSRLELRACDSRYINLRFLKGASKMRPGRIREWVTLRSPKGFL